MHDRAIAMVKATHPCFLVKGVGVWWKIHADGSGPQAGIGFGGLDPYHLYVVYRLLDPTRAELASEIADVEALVMKGYKTFVCHQDLGLGIMLWCAHFFPRETWAMSVTTRCHTMLQKMWVSVPPGEAGYFARAPNLRDVCVAFANYGAGIGLQAAGLLLPHVHGMHKYLETHMYDDPEFAQAAITHVMACNSHFPGCMLLPGLRDLQGDVHISDDSNTQVAMAVDSQLGVTRKSDMLNTTAAVQRGGGNALG
jgi:hypothetical protein